VQWAVENAVAQPDHVAIIGSGFGGYAALAGLAFTPEQFRCAATYGAPGNLVAMLEAAPANARDELYLRVGDLRTAEGRSSLRERSPALRAGQMRRPLLMVLGGRDPRPSRAEFDQIAQSLRGRRIELTTLVFPEEGGELVRPQNRLAYYTVLEHFLASCMGGRAEPVGAAFEGAEMVAYDGAARVPGLSAFARRAAAPTAQPVTQELSTDIGGPVEMLPTESAVTPPPAPVAASPPSP
jgi:hypothetical protein